MNSKEGKRKPTRFSSLTAQEAKCKVANMSLDKRPFAAVKVTLEKDNIYNNYA